MTHLFFRLTLTVALSAVLAGCGTTAEQMAQRNEERCAERGYQPKTDAFADCVLRLETERTERMEARRRDMVERSAVPPSNRGY